jgi:hypothetical protein
MINIFTSFVLGYFLAFLWEFVTAKVLKIDHFARQKGFHLHHSIFGLICYIFSVYYLFLGDINNFMYFIAFGSGIISQHIRTKDGFVFITKC